MVDGVNLVRGTIVQYLVEAQTKVELVYVTLLLPNTAVTIVLLMDQHILKPKDAMKIRARPVS